MTSVLILMSDEHNVRVSSVYGHPAVDTPNMERLAATGTVFDAAYCPSPLCAPSRSSFLAGLPVHRVGVYNNCTLNDVALPSYGKVLHDQGVHSVCIGKTDAYATSDLLGYSEVRLPGDRKPPGDVNFRRNPLSIRADGPDRARMYGPRDDAFAKDLRVIDDAVAWLTDRAPTVEGPWTLTVNIVAPHFPHVATPELWEKYDGQGDLPDVRGDAATANHPYALDLRRHFQTGTFSDEDIRGLRQGYLARVDFVDQQLGRLLDTLDATDQSDDTVVAYTSDHGEMLGRFDMWWKCAMYEDSVRVPLIVSGPGFAPGRRSATPVTLLDLQATMFRATGAVRPPEWWGTPLQEVAIDDPHRVVFAEYHGHGVRGGSFMVRKGDWKLLHHADAPDQLFNLAIDPDELHNRIEECPEIADALLGELRARCDPDLEFARACVSEQRQLDQLALIDLSAE